MQCLGRPRAVGQLVRLGRPHKQTRSFGRKVPISIRPSKMPPLYELSDVVLDLDAEGSRHVRECNEQDEKDIARKWSGVTEDIYALRNRFEDFQRGMAKHNERFEKTVSDPFHPWRVTDCDTMSAALLGNPYFIGAQYSSENVSDIPTLLHRNGIPEQMAEHEPNTLRLLLHSQKRSASYAASGLDRAGFFSCLNRHRFSLPELRRSISQTIQSPEGCEIVASYGSEICQALLLPENYTYDKIFDILVLVNNLAIRLKANGTPVGESLCGLGLRAAASSLQLPALQNFVQICHDEGHFESVPFASAAIDGALSTILLILHSSNQPPSSMIHSIRRRAVHSGLFTLLTGRTLYGIASKQTIREAIRESGSFLGAYAKYILLLGEIGALRTLQHEWNRTARTPVMPITPGRDDSKFSLFANAVLRFALRSRARITSGMVAETGKAYVHGTYAEGLAADIQSIVSRETQDPQPENVASLREPLQYGLQHMHPVFRKHVATAFYAEDKSWAVKELEDLSTNQHADFWMAKHAVGKQ